MTGIRQELLCWDMETGDLVKRMVAHFQRIVDIKSLVVGSDNAVITSSIDRSIKAAGSSISAFIVRIRRSTLINAQSLMLFKSSSDMESRPHL